MPITHELSAILFAVIGSTGTQGGSVIQAIKASSKPYRVRAITRDPLKPAAKELEKLGCEVFAADVDDISTLKAAFQDAHYAFAMTALFRVRSQGKGRFWPKNVAVRQNLKLTPNVDLGIWSRQSSN